MNKWHRFDLRLLTPHILSFAHDMISIRRLLMRWASHSWRPVPRTLLMWSRLSWLWLHPSRLGTLSQLKRVLSSNAANMSIEIITKFFMISGWPANRLHLMPGRRRCRFVASPSTRRHPAALPRFFISFNSCKL